MPDIVEAKEALDKIISKARAYLYKPIQIAEILYHDRTEGIINLLELETYRTQSKGWRDAISIPLNGRTSNSSSKYQDDLFNENAMPPVLLNELGIENRKTGGAVEAYIYKCYSRRHNQFAEALNYCKKATKETFDVKKFIDSFWEAPGLRRSIDKIYEIVVYSLFSTLVNALNMQVEISIDEARQELLSEFEDFSKKVMSIDLSQPTYVHNARVYRVGVTNAADRGLDMYSNWGPAIQIKHLSLIEELAQNIVESVSSDRIIIVCKEAERKVILSLLTQIGWRAKIQSIVTENELVAWYERALRGSFADQLGAMLLGMLSEEIIREFPSIDEYPEILKNRRYETIHDDFWD